MANAQQRRWLDHTSGQTGTIHVGADGRPIKGTFQADRDPKSAQKPNPFRILDNAVAPAYKMLRGAEGAVAAKGTEMAMGGVDALVRPFTPQGAKERVTDPFGGAAALKPALAPEGVPSELIGAVGGGTAGAMVGHPHIGAGLGGAAGRALDIARADTGAPLTADTAFSFAGDVALRGGANAALSAVGANLTKGIAQGSLSGLARLAPTAATTPAARMAASTAGAAGAGAMMSPNDPLGGGLIGGLAGAGGQMVSESAGFLAPPTPSTRKGLYVDIPAERVARAPKSDQDKYFRVMDRRSVHKAKLQSRAAYNQQRMGIAEAQAQEDAALGNLKTREAAVRQRLTTQEGRRLPADADQQTALDEAQAQYTAASRRTAEAKTALTEQLAKDQADWLNRLDETSVEAATQVRADLLPALKDASDNFVTEMYKGAKGAPPTAVSAVEGRLDDLLAGDEVMRGEAQKLLDRYATKPVPGGKPELQSELSAEDFLSAMRKERTAVKGRDQRRLFTREDQLHSTLAEAIMDSLPESVQAQVGSARGMWKKLAPVRNRAIERFGLNVDEPFIQKAADTITSGTVPRGLSERVPDAPKPSLDSKRLLKGLEQRFGIKVKPSPELENIYKTLSADEIAATHKMVELELQQERAGLQHQRAQATIRGKFQGEAEGVRNKYSRAQDRAKDLFTQRRDEAKLTSSRRQEDVRQRGRERQEGIRDTRANERQALKAKLEDTQRVREFRSRVRRLVGTGAATIGLLSAADYRLYYLLRNSMQFVPGN